MHGLYDLFPNSFSSRGSCSRIGVRVPQIALAILTSSIGVRVRRFCGFVLGGLLGRVSSDVCMGEGSQIQEQEAAGQVLLVVHVSGGVCSQMWLEGVADDVLALLLEVSMVVLDGGMG